MSDRDLVIIGGGPAGMAAAVAARNAGITDILIIEREKQIGGILKQCIHNGFGIHNIKKDLTGPEYAEYYMKKVIDEDIEIISDCMVIGLNSDKILTVSSSKGIEKISARAVILSTGCRERTAGAVKLAGCRPSGVYTAGLAQYMLNMQNLMPGRKIIIRGSGDIGLIMARRLHLEGAEVIGVIERKSYSSGLQRNIVQCLNDFEIPILYQHIVTKVHGQNRVDAVTIAEVDGKSRPIPGTSHKVACDTLILALGLIPENELAREAGIALDGITGGAIVDSCYQTTVSGVFACGNALHVHDLVDYVTEEGREAGDHAAIYLSSIGAYRNAEFVDIVPGLGIQYILPQKVIKNESTMCKFRVNRPFYNVNMVLKNSSGVQVKKYFFARMHPAEMVKVKIPAGITTETDIISVDIEKK